MIKEFDEYKKSPLLKEAILNSKSFNTMKIKGFCEKSIFDIYENDGFVIVIDNNGKTILYENGSRNTFENLREFIELFGSKFLKHSILDTERGRRIKKIYEDTTGLIVRNIYQYKF